MFADFTLENLRLWLADAVAQGKARSTLARRTASVRAFSSWAYHQGYLEADVAARLVTPKINRQLPTVVRPETAEEMVSGSNPVDEPADSPEALRDRAMLELLYATGIRVGELTGLNVGDVDLVRHVAKVTGKGNKQRVVPFGVPAARTLSLIHI
mgnify:FL=1